MFQSVSVCDDVLRDTFHCPVLAGTMSQVTYSSSYLQIDEKFFSSSVSNMSNSVSNMSKSMSNMSNSVSNMMSKEKKMFIKYVMIY